MKALIHFHSVRSHLKTVLTLFSLFFAFYCISQDSPDLSVLKDDSLLNRKLLTAAIQKFKADSSGIKDENSKYIIDLFRERSQLIQQMFSDGAIISASEPASYLQSIATEIIKQNPFLEELHPQIFFSRAWWPNASSFGEGTIVFNIGLFTKLETESEVAFVLAHELAHLYLDHGNKSIYQYVNTVYSEKFQQQLKDIKNKEYGAGHQLEQLVKGLAFNTRRHGREHETEADSMAVEFMKKTSFDVAEALSCLAILDKVDEDTFSNFNEEIEQYLGTSEFPFQARWIKKETTLFADAPNSQEEKELADSLKTHPDCTIRIKKLGDLTSHIQQQGKELFPINKTEFLKLKDAFRYEIIAYCYRQNQLSRALYYSLQLATTESPNGYLVSMTGKCLDRFYVAQKEHVLGRLTELPGPSAPASYNTLLLFIQRIRLTELGQLSYYFLQHYQEKYKQNEEFIYALILSKENNGKAEEKNEWVRYYKTNFSKRKYNF